MAAFGAALLALSVRLAQSPTVPAGLATGSALSLVLLSKVTGLALAFEPLFGAEQFHYGIVGTDGVTPTTGGEQYSQAAREIALLRSNFQSGAQEPPAYAARRTAFRVRSTRHGTRAHRIVRVPRRAPVSCAWALTLLFLSSRKSC